MEAIATSQVCNNSDHLPDLSVCNSLEAKLDSQVPPGEMETLVTLYFLVRVS